MLVAEASVCLEVEGLPGLAVLVVLQGQVEVLQGWETEVEADTGDHDDHGDEAVQVGREGLKDCPKLEVDVHEKGQEGQEGQEGREIQPRPDTKILDRDSGRHDLACRLKTSVSWHWGRGIVQTDQHHNLLASN